MNNPINYSDPSGHVMITRPINPWIVQDCTMTCVHVGLDAAGLVPGFGIVPDAINTAIYAVEGDAMGVGMSAAAMIPAAGLGATAGKYAVKGGASVVAPTLKLRRNMELAGVAFKSGEEAHHMVAAGAKLAAGARDVLKRYKIDVNSSANGVALPKNVKLAGQTGQTAHRGQGIHSTKYYEYVNERITSAKNKDEVLKRLQQLRDDLNNGKKPWEKDND